MALHTGDELVPMPALVLRLMAAQLADMYRCLYIDLAHKHTTALAAWPKTLATTSELTVG
jgi:hypothetical protein